MKIAVLYFSRTGNTRQIAEAIASEVGVNAKPLGKREALPACDLLFLGAPVFGGQIPKEVTYALTQLERGTVKRVALFGTQGKTDAQIQLMKKILDEKGIPVAGTFTCKGAVKILFIKHNQGLPGETDLSAAREFARKTVIPAVGGIPQ